MTTTATRLSITRAARIGAELIDALVLNEGLSEPGSITARIDYDVTRGHHEAVRLMFYAESSFDDVREWARVLEVETTGYVNGDDVEFIDAVMEHRGVVVSLASNRPRAVAESSAALNGLAL